MTDYTIIYAYRNRDTERVKQSLLSLQDQIVQNFEVIFVDYGSTTSFAEGIKACIDTFSFATYFYVAHPGLLWNKPKAFNFGISQAKTPYLILADVDVLFAPQFTKALEGLKAEVHFSLFKIGYMSREISDKVSSTSFKQWIPNSYGDTFGIGLFPKQALNEVCGLDPFFHFYGSEDEDLNLRLQHAGYTLKRCQDDLLRHQWHERYPRKKDKVLTLQPRLFNALRLNQQHLFWHQKLKTIEHADHEVWQDVMSKDNQSELLKPELILNVSNKTAEIKHLLQVQLPHYNGKIVKVVFKEAEDYRSLKFKVKQILGKNSQPYSSLKQINDMVLEDILLKYRHHNYAYQITEDLKELQFTINLSLNGLV